MVTSRAALARLAVAACVGLTLSTSGEAGAPSATPAPAARAADIDRNGVLILVRTTLIAVDQANETGNYTVLRDLAAPSFQDSNTDARLGEIFASLRNQKLDLSGIVVLDPQLTLLPQIESTGAMHMAGFFPSVPTQINFELAYVAVAGRWRLSGISVGVASSSPVPPAAAPAAAAPGASPPKPARPKT